MTLYQMKLIPIIMLLVSGCVTRTQNITEKEYDFTIHRVVTEEYKNSVTFRYEMCVHLKDQSHVEGYIDPKPLADNSIIGKIESSSIEIMTAPFDSLKISWSSDSLRIWNSIALADTERIAFAFDGKVYATMDVARLNDFIKHNADLHIAFPLGEPFPRGVSR